MNRSPKNHCRLVFEDNSDRRITATLCGSSATEADIFPADAWEHRDLLGCRACREALAQGERQ